MLQSLFKLLLTTNNISHLFLPLLQCIPSLVGDFGYLLTEEESTILFNKGMSLLGDDLSLENSERVGTAFDLCTAMVEGRCLGAEKLIINSNLLFKLQQGFQSETDTIIAASFALAGM